MTRKSVFKEMTDLPEERGGVTLVDLRSLPSPMPKKLDSENSQRFKIPDLHWKPFLALLACPISLVPVIVLAVLADGASEIQLKRRCYPNGMWEASPGASWRIMDSSYFFTPNLSFGSMSFNAVKVIDVIWDLIVGRGGQVLLAYINYRVFNEWLLLHMETHPTPYKLYTALSFKTVSMFTLGALGREFLAFGERNWIRFFRWLTILCMFLATVYVLSFPTLMSAMTGYIPMYTPYINDTDGNLIEFTQYEIVVYIIHDSERISLPTGPFNVLETNMSMVVAAEDYLYDYQNSTSQSSNFTLPNGTQIHLEAPTLNIEHSMTFTSPMNETRSLQGQVPFATSGSGPILRWDYMTTHGTCQPGSTYQWGFSYIFLFMMSIFNCVWVVMTASIWLDVRRRSRMYKEGKRPGLLRAVMDLSAVVREELGPDAQTLSEEALKRGLRESTGAMVVQRTGMRMERTTTGAEVRKGGWGRIKSGSKF